MQRATANSIRMMNFIAITEKTVTLAVTDVYYKSTNVTKNVTNVFNKLILNSNPVCCKYQYVFQVKEQKITTTALSKGNGGTIL